MCESVLPPSQGFVLIFYVLLHMLGTWETIYLTDIKISEQGKMHGDAVFFRQENSVPNAKAEQLLRLQT